MDWYRSRWFYVCILLLIANLVVLSGITPVVQDTAFGQSWNKNCDDSGRCVECEDGEQVASDKDPNCGSCDGKKFVQDCSESTCTDCDLCAGEDAAKPGGLGECETCQRGDKKQQCGEIDGKKCGSCTSEKKICDESTNTCYNPCERQEAQCGTVKGVKCKNECADMAKKVCNEEKNSCYNPCDDAECGTAEGVQCKNQCRDKEGLTCDQKTNKCVSSKSGNGNNGGSGNGNGNSGNGGSNGGNSSGNGSGEGGSGGNGPPRCEPKEECPSNACGRISDGCDGTLECGDCGDGKTCKKKECVDDCDEEKGTVKSLENQLKVQKELVEETKDRISKLEDKIDVIEGKIQYKKSLKNSLVADILYLVEKLKDVLASAAGFMADPDILYPEDIRNEINQLEKSEKELQKEINQLKREKKTLKIDLETEEINLSERRKLVDKTEAKLEKAREKLDECLGGRI